MRSACFLPIGYRRCFLLLTFPCLFIAVWAASPGTSDQFNSTRSVAADYDLAALPKSRRKTHEVVEKTNSIGMKLVLIPAGEFTLGCRLSGSEVAKQFGVSDSVAGISLPPRQVSIPSGFHMGKHEVTVGQFAMFVESTGYKTDAERKGKAGGVVVESGERLCMAEYSWRNAGWQQSAVHPVVNVTWNDATAFCKWLSKKEGRTYRLPTQSEWEYACRAGSQTHFHSGDSTESLNPFANTRDDFEGSLELMKRDGHVYAAPVGSYRANAFGLHDMHGNVAEWCSNQLFLRSSRKALRGGSWSTIPIACRSARWEDQLPDMPGCEIGFRVVEGEPDHPNEDVCPPPASKEQDSLSYEVRKHRFGWRISSKLEAGAKIDAHDSNGFTALYWAAVELHDPHLVHSLIVEHGADPNVPMYGGMTVVDVLGQWLWGAANGCVSITPVMRRCPISIPFGLLEEDFIEAKSEHERVRLRNSLAWLREDTEWIVWILYRGGARPTIPLDHSETFDKRCEALELAIHTRLLEKTSDDVCRQRELQKKADDLRDWIVRRSRPETPDIIQRNRDARAYVGGFGRPGQSARIVKRERSNALGLVFEIGEKRDEVRELEKPVRLAERWVQLRFGCDRSETKQRYDELRRQVESARD